jgi:hypothetical protein
MKGREKNAGRGSAVQLQNRTRSQLKSTRKVS